MTITKLTSFLFPLLFLSASPLSAKPTWMSEINLTELGPHRPTKPITLTYDLSWKGSVTAGQATIRFGHADKRYPKSYIAQSYGSTTGFARKLFKFDFNYTSFLRPRSLRPQVFIADERTKDERKLTETRFSRKSVTATEKETQLDTGQTGTSSSTFAYGNPLGVHSAVLWVRSLEIPRGQEVVFAIMPFKTPYLCRVKNLGKEKHNSRRTIKYSLQLQKINKETLELQNYNKVKSLILWVSDDAERLPLEFRSKVFIGDVRAVLTSK